MRRRLILKIHGNVQGVGFRYNVKFFSKNHGIFGWVKNESDKSVAVVAEGDNDDLHQLLDYCYNGVLNAEIIAIDATWDRGVGDFNEFEIK